MSLTVKVSAIGAAVICTSDTPPTSELISTTLPHTGAKEKAKRRFISIYITRAYMYVKQSDRSQQQSMVSTKAS